MKISSSTKIAALLKASPQALDAIVSLSPAFAKLRNPLLRKLMASRVSIGQAAGIGGCSPADFFEALRPLGFEAEETSTEQHTPVEDKERPGWLLDAYANGHINWLDVRPVLAKGEDPLKIILKEIKGLRKGGVMAVVNSFEPVPLIKLLSDKGFRHHLEPIRADEVITYFLNEKGDSHITEAPVPKSDSEAFDQLLAVFSGRMITIDVRELEMPQPMLTILENLHNLPEGFALFVHHKRLPVYLLPELEELHYTYTVKDSVDGIKLLIYKEA